MFSNNSSSYIVEISQFNIDLLLEGLLILKLQSYLLNLKTKFYGIDESKLI